MARNQRTITLETGEPEEKKRNKWLIAAVLVLVGAPVIGSTLAATITINSNSSVEFAQGTAPTSACDSTINAKPEAGWDSASGTFKLGKITVSGVSVTACNGKQLRIQVVDSSNNLVNWCGASCTAAKITMATSGASTIDTSTDDVTFGVSGTDASTTFTITLVGSSKPAASDSNKILLETL